MVIPGHNDDENGFRRQKMSVSRLKKTTREDLVARKMSFQPKKDDENGFRRQK